MIDAGGAAKYAQFVRLLVDGRDVASAARGVYNTDLPALARGYAGEVARKGR
jgi:hypothetical protein